MAVVTIAEPTADQQMQAMYNRAMRATAPARVMTPDQKYAVCLIELGPVVDQPGDYAALKTAIEAVPGIQEISLLIDGQCPASVPGDTELRLYVSAHTRLDNTPPLE